MRCLRTPRPRTFSHTSAEELRGLAAAAGTHLETRNAFLRGMLVEAAQSAVRYEPDLRREYRLPE
jgi:hypothetical protein